jgi:hypothetical protein
MIGQATMDLALRSAIKEARSGPECPSLRMCDLSSDFDLPDGRSRMVNKSIRAPSLYLYIVLFISPEST